MSLGGIRDEAEIRGHRRTYIGSMPGRIIQELRRAGTRNPVMMLDEIDKLGRRFPRRSGERLARSARPAAEPRLRRSLPRRAVSTSRRSSSSPRPTTSTLCPRPLRDRMEIIEIAGYTEREKLEIAQPLSRQAAARGKWPQAGAVRVAGSRARPRDRRLHPRSRRARTRTPDRRRLPRRRGAGRPRAKRST